MLRLHLLSNRRRLAPVFPLMTGPSPKSYCNRIPARSPMAGAPVVTATSAMPHKVYATGDHLLRDLYDMIRAQGEPFGSMSIYARYRVFGSDREKGVVVTLDGQGADEMFAGYDGYSTQRLYSVFERRRLWAAKRFLDGWARWPNRSTHAAAKETAAQFVRRHFQVVLNEYESRASPAPDAEAFAKRSVTVRYSRVRVSGVRSRWLSSYLWSRLTSRRLPALLRHGDRNPMHFSIESRVPFLDTSLTEPAFGSPKEFLISERDESKHIFRRGMQDFVPDEILDRRDKIGFVTPESSWLDSFRHSIFNSGWGGDTRIGFLNTSRRVATVALSAPDSNLGLGSGGFWRVVNLKPWVELFDVEAS
ncbi:MAG: asparagine synthase [Microbacteriaceae bacterium]|nr:MAG: asparagine synthase [Microbacteriaceae bacterium]